LCAIYLLEETHSIFPHPSFLGAFLILKSAPTDLAAGGSPSGRLVIRCTVAAALILSRWRLNAPYPT